MQLFRLVIPVIAVIAASLIALAATAIFFAQSKDQSTEAAERQVLSSMLGARYENLRALAEDNVWWNQAVDNIWLSENRAWLRGTFGDTVKQQASLDGLAVLRADNSILYENSGDTRNRPDYRDLLASGLASVIGGLQPDSDSDSAGGLLESNGTLYLLGISLVQPNEPDAYDAPLPAGRRPVLLMYKMLTPDLLEQIAADTGLSALHYGEPLPSANAGWQPSSISGAALGRFSWTSARPGSELLSQMVWPALVLVAVIGLTIAQFITKARALIGGLKQADRAKMSFLASMSHEVRTPLNAIVGFAELLRLELYGKIEGDKNKEYLDIIRSSGEHLLTIINDILDISKLEAGRMDVYAEAMDPVEVVTESVRIVKPSADDKNVRMLTELQSAVILSDERIIRQVLINILSNAVKFTGSGGQVSVRSEPIDGGGYRITISDTGRGMSEDEIRVALEPFGQVRQHQDQMMAGTGLGLPLVNRFMGLIGGTMTIRSAPGHGTSVTLDFPQSVPSLPEGADQGLGFSEGA